MASQSPTTTSPTLHRNRPPTTMVHVGRRNDLGPGLILTAIGTLAAVAIHQVASPVSALVAAVVLGTVVGNSNVASADTAPGLGFVSKRVLRVGVVLLGLRLSVDQVTALGWQTLAVVVGTVTLTFFGVQGLGRRMGLSRDLSLLVGTGFSICGLSAIAAVEGSTDANEEEVTAAMGLVTLFGTVAIFVLPALGAVAGLSDSQLGTWIGASVHDTAQVVAAAGASGTIVLSVAITTKLTRVLLLAPLVAGLNIRRNDRLNSGNRSQLLPPFVLGFVAMIGLRTTGLLPEDQLATAKAIEGVALTAAMFGLGTNVKIDRIRSLGLKPLALGAVAWAVVGGSSLAGVLLLN